MTKLGSACAPSWGCEFAQVQAFSDRVWELRANRTVYDSWYVALAEWLATDLVTPPTDVWPRPAAPRRAVRRR
jgi:hypothetical protein